MSTQTRLTETHAAQTNFGHSKRVVIAGHLDTVPANKNFPGKKTDTEVIGLGAVDMKSGVAAALKLASQLSNAKYDITYLFYEAEEIETKFPGGFKDKTLEELHKQLDEAVANEDYETAAKIRDEISKKS